ncbi:MAG: hypothetical protein Q9167_006325 [Letrouitia subvulpina]
MGYNDTPNSAEDISPLLKPSNFSTPEFRQMISSTSTLIDELLARLQVKDGRFKSSLQRLTWPIMKDDVKRYAAKVQRIASWFMLVTTSDNVWSRENNASLCEANPELWNMLTEMYSYAKGSSQHQQLKRLANTELESLLGSLLSQCSNVTLVVDALNEGKEPFKLYALLERLTQGNNNLFVVISSTEELGTTCTPLKTTVVSIDHDQTSSDIQTYIETWINSQDDLHSLPSGLKAEIKDVLQKKSGGVALRDVPRTLEKTYRDILLRIKQEDVELAKQTLTWVAFAAFALKPLSLRELSEAVIIGHQYVEIDDDRRLLKPEILLRICGSLVRYNSNTTEVTLSHSSVWNYLTSAEICYSDASEFYIEIRDMDNSVIRRCLNYLLQPAFSSGACGDWGLKKRLHDWPLLEYIAGTFIYHLDFVYLGDDSLVELLLQFFSTHSLPHGGNFGAWIEAFNPKTSSNVEQSTPLYYASRFGLLRIVQLILKTDGTRTLEMPGGVLGSTPLHVAAWQGQEEVVEELLRAGANAKEKNFAGESGLLWACRFGFEGIAKMLREAGATLDGVEASMGSQPTIRQCDLCNLSH